MPVVRQPGTRWARHRGGRADPGPDVENRFARMGRDGGGKEDGIDGHPIAVGRLAQLHVSIEQRVFGRRGGGRRRSGGRRRGGGRIR